MGIGKPSKIVKMENENEIKDNNQKVIRDTSGDNKKRNNKKQHTNYLENPRKEDKNKEIIKNEYDSMKKMESNLNDMKTHKMINEDKGAQKNNIIVKKSGKILSNIDNNNENINNNADLNLLFDIKNSKKLDDTIIFNNDKNELDFSFNNIEEKPCLPNNYKKDNLNQEQLLDDSTNIIFSITIPKKHIKEFTQLYLNNNPVQNAYNFEFKENIILIYHIKVREDLPRGKLEPYFMRYLNNEYYYYYCTINYFSNKNNFIYNIKWKTQVKDNKRIDLDMNIFNQNVLIYFYFLYLQRLNEKIALIKDLIIQRIEKFDTDDRINFTEFLFLLIKSIELKNEKLIQKCLSQFKNPQKFEYKKLDNFIVSEDNIKKHILNKEEIEDIKYFNEENRKFFELVKINLLMRYYEKNLRHI